MEDIKMVDTKAQYAHLKPELDAAFSAVMERMELVNGPQVQSFARKLEVYMQVRHAFPCANGTDAICIALRALDLPKGAEVIIPAFHHEAVAEEIVALGLKPVFADVHPDIFTLDPASVAQVITQTTAAILPAHLFGQCADMQPIMELAAQHDLWVVEDSSQSFGAVYTAAGGNKLKAGAIGHIGTVSFFPAKPVSGPDEGGALLTNDLGRAHKIGQITDPGQAENVATHLYMDTLKAAMLEVKIRYIDDYNASRQRIAEFYYKAFSASELVQVPYIAPYSTHIYQQYTIKVPAALRNGLQEYLRDQHIPSMVYYPQPLHLQERFAHLRYKSGDFPVAEQLSESVLSLPMHSELKQDQLEYICQHVIQYLKNHS